MSAKLDKTQPIQFYFGNAAKDLSHLLPPEDDKSPVDLTADKSILEMETISSLVEQSLVHLQALRDNRRQLSFLIKDIKRMIG